MIKILLRIGIIFIGLAVAGGLALKIHWWRMNEMAKRVEGFIAQNHDTVSANELIPGSWQKICFVPGNYNAVTQSEIDRVLGEKGLVRAHDLVNDGYQIHVVIYGDTPRVRVYSRLELQDKGDIVCTRNRQSRIHLTSSAKSAFPTLSTTFEVQFVARERDEKLRLK